MEYFYRPNHELFSPTLTTFWNYYHTLTLQKITSPKGKTPTAKMMKLIKPAKKQESQRFFNATSTSTIDPQMKKVKLVKHSEQ
jgi:hypothetical protein